MKDIRVLVSACGAPGCSTLIRYLRGVSEREIFVVGVDSDEEAIGRFMADRFYKVPLASEKEYLQRINDILEAERIDVFYCVSSAEVGIVAAAKNELEQTGAKVMVSAEKNIRLAENKGALYQTLAERGIPTPDFRIAETFEQFLSAVEELGFPQKEVCFKPPVSKGSRGFRILSDSMSKRALLLHEKPNSLYMSLSEFKDIFEQDATFPAFVVMEVATGTHYDVMTLCGHKGALLTTVKTREGNRWGVINRGELVDSPTHRRLVREIIEVIPLKYNVCLQFIGDKIIEINPRPSTFIYQEELNEPYLAIKLALSEICEEEIRNLEPKIQYGRRMIRYMDQVFFAKDQVDYGPFPFLS